MKKIFLISFFVSFLVASSQETQLKIEKSSYFQLDYFKTNILPQNGAKHLITGRPKGFIFSWNKRSFGEKLWEQHYNYPDVGFAFGYQDFENNSLGKLYALYTHYNFYFFKRNLQFRIGQGIAYTTSPYDKETNFRNNAYGSDFMSSTYVMFNYHKENILKGMGFKAGISLMHYSNANFRAPNTSTNTFALNPFLRFSNFDFEILA